MKGIIHPNLTAIPFIVSIPTGQWGGTSEDYYINVTASNVTADSILVPTYDHTSDSQLNGPIWCVPAAGSFTIHTSAIPSGTVTIMVQFIGTLGEAQYQVLADVYSKSQTDALIAQSTAHTQMENLFSAEKSGVTITYQRAIKSGNRIYFTIKATLPATEYTGEWLIHISQNGTPYGIPSPFPAINTNGGAYIFYASDSGIIGNDETYPAGTYIISGSYAV